LEAPKHSDQLDFQDVEHDPSLSHDAVISTPALAGGLLQIAAPGAGALSFDNRAKRTAPYSNAAVTCEAEFEPRKVGENPP
jgi:hypothetical protein